MKFKMTVMKLAAVTGMTAALIVGCSTPQIPVTMNVAGKVRLNGVSKIALADFNSLKGDAFTGEMAADAETCALVKRAVASAFYASPMYQIVDLDIEKKIHDAQDAKPNKRYDAVIYGRLWWQITKEANGKYPRVYTLETWRNETYKQKVLGKMVPAVAKVTQQKKDVLQMLDYRVQNATLMLTLSIYRLDSNGGVEKIVDTYQVSNQGFTLMNGELKVEGGSVGVKDDDAVTRLQKTGDDTKTTTAYEDMFETKPVSLGDVGAAAADAGKALVGGLANSVSAIGGGLFGGGKEEAKSAPAKKGATKSDRKVDANGKLILTQDTVSMPTELQAKLMLASSISKGLSAKLAPSKAEFNVNLYPGRKWYHFFAKDETRLENLLKNGAFQSAREYSLYMLRNKLGKQVCDKLVQFLPEFAEPCTYPVPDSTEKFPVYDEKMIDELMKSDFNLYFYTLGTARAVAEALEGQAKFMDAMVSYLAGENLDLYFYALGVCCEARQQMEEAAEYYRFSFNVKPSEDSALGLSRIYLALGEKARIKQTQKAAKKAAKKTSMD